MLPAIQSQYVRYSSNEAQNKWKAFSDSIIFYSRTFYTHAKKENTGLEFNWLKKIQTKGILAGWTFLQ